MELKVCNLSKSYGDKEILKDINFDFKDNCIYGLVGRNGSGKTTFMNSVDGDIRINDGKFYLDDKELDTNDIGYIVSTPVVPEFLTGKEFLQFYLEIHNKEKDKEIDFDYYFDLVDLKHEDQDKLLKDYSHGMKSKMQLLINIIIR